MRLKTPIHIRAYHDSEKKLSDTHWKFVHGKGKRRDETWDTTRVLGLAHLALELGYCRTAAGILGVDCANVPEYLVYVRLGIA